MLADGLTKPGLKLQLMDYITTGKVRMFVPHDRDILVRSVTATMLDHSEKDLLDMKG